MKILFLNGSPKSSGSASERIIESLHKSLGHPNECATLWVMGLGKEEFFDRIQGVSAVVICFPLYADGIPSHLLRFLCGIKDEVGRLNPEVTVYAVSNNGFYEGRQNHLALSMVRHFCDSSGIRWGRGLGIGAGGMLNEAEMGKGPLTNIGVALDELSNSIREGTGGDDFFTMPNFPKFLYKIGGHIGWVKEAKRNGLRRKDLYNRP